MKYIGFESQGRGYCHWFKHNSVISSKKPKQN